MFRGFVIWNKTACQENMECEQLAAFVATMQLLANYLRAKDNRNGVGT